MNMTPRDIMNTSTTEELPKIGDTASSLFFLFVALFIAAIARFMSAGWLLFLFCPAYLVIFGLHTAIHLRASRKVQTAKSGYLAVILLSHLCLIAGMLLQVDYSDAPGAYMALVKADQMPYWIAEMGLIWEILVLIPLVITWVLLLFWPRQAARPEQGRAI